MLNLPGPDWTDLTGLTRGPAPVPRSDHGFAAAGGALYVHGGYGLDTGPPPPAAINGRIAVCASVNGCAVACASMDGRAAGYASVNGCICSSGWQSTPVSTPSHVHAGQDSES